LFQILYLPGTEAVTVPIRPDFGLIMTGGSPAMSEPIQPVTLPPVQDPQQEARWLEMSLHQWLDQEFIPEVVNQEIAQQAARVYCRQRMEGENDLGALVIAILTEMQGFDFSKSFFSEFAVANAVSDLILRSLGVDRCCGQ